MFIKIESEIEIMENKKNLKGRVISVDDLREITAAAAERGVDAFPEAELEIAPGSKIKFHDATQLAVKILDNKSE